ncbi:hypothetical protein BZM27_53900 [Paraburkholderia steynii]|uniref:Uncharacterized protein n=1 Tax=Paraburkholderia steynii TaxID=1245441 RepID=A0A4R0X250_9BURK|nr:hypothetical protein BZM27_53900 [Paraburkholderia steynii]
MQIDQYIGGLIRKAGGWWLHSKTSCLPFLPLKLRCFRPTIERGRTITADELAKTAGFKNRNAANRQYGLVGKAVHELTRCALQKDDHGEQLMTSAIEIGLDKATEDGQFRWKLRDHVACALRALGIVAE